MNTEETTPTNRVNFQKHLSHTEVMENIRRTNARRNFLKSKRMNTVFPQDFRLADHLRGRA